MSWRRRREGWPAVVGVAAALLLGGCVVDFPQDGHDRCQSNADCLEGRACVSSRCVEPGGGDTGPVDPGDTHAPDADGDVALADLVEDADSSPPDTTADTADTTLPPDTSGPDSDGDGVPNALDNCIDVANPAQEDYDGNGVGEVCQPAQHSAVVITEVMADPEQGLGPGDGGEVLEWQRQYIEIHNAGSAPVDLSGLVLENGAGARVTISSGAPAVVAPGGLFVVSGSLLPGADGVTALAGNDAHGDAGFVLDKGQSGDGVTAFETISLLRPLLDRPQAPFLVDRVAFSKAFRRGTSRELSWAVARAQLPALANDERGDWCDAGRAPGAGRDGGSPGAANAGCYDPLALRCSEPPLLELDAYAFGDLTDPQVAADNNNVCSPPQHGPALARDLTWRVEVTQPTTVELRFDPVPTVTGDQSAGGMSLEPWYAMVYWREDICPSQPPVTEPSLCLSPSDAPLRSTVQLEPGVSYYFTADGQNRQPAAPFEEGRLTFGLFTGP